MTRFIVEKGNETKTIEAKRFEIKDGGVLVFYESPSDSAELGRVATKQKRAAFKHWAEVRRE